jgi:hypothetical protein
MSPGEPAPPTFIVPPQRATSARLGWPWRDGLGSAGPRTSPIGLPSLAPRWHWPGGAPQQSGDTGAEADLDKWQEVLTVAIRLRQVLERSAS